RQVDRVDAVLVLVGVDVHGGEEVEEGLLVGDGDEDDHFAVYEVGAEEAVGADGLGDVDPFEAVALEHRLVDALVHLEVFAPVGDFGQVLGVGDEVLDGLRADEEGRGGRLVVGGPGGRGGEQQAQAGQAGEQTHAHERTP